MVEATGFEPAALCSQSRCATKLRYASMLFALLMLCISNFRFCFARPLAVPKITFRLGAPSNFDRCAPFKICKNFYNALLRFPKFCCALVRRQNFDRCATLASLNRPQDALRRLCPKHLRYQTALRLEILDIIYHFFLFVKKYYLSLFFLLRK